MSIQIQIHAKDRLEFASEKRKENTTPYGAKETTVGSHSVSAPW